MSEESGSDNIQKNDETILDRGEIVIAEEVRARGSQFDLENWEEKKSTVEAVIFASEEPITFKQLKAVIDGEEQGSTPVSTEQQNELATGVDTSEGTANELPDDVSRSPRRRRRVKKSGLTNHIVQRIVSRLNEEYSDANRSFRIVEISGGYAFQTTKDFGVYIARMFAERAKRRLTQSALETLAIIAFRQPISKPDIEAIRGVGADFVIKSLLEKNLISILGRDESVGRPLLYGTTDEFLKHFGLNSIDNLPKPREIEELMEEEDSLGVLSIEETDLYNEKADQPSPGQDYFSTIPFGTMINQEDTPESVIDVSTEDVELTLDSIEQAEEESEEQPVIPRAKNEDDFEYDDR